MDAMGDQRRENIKRYEAVIIRAYNKITGKELSNVEQMPAEALKFIGGIDYNALIEPLVVEDLKAGIKSTFLALRYGVDRSRIKRIKKKYE